MVFRAQIRASSKVYLKSSEERETDTSGVDLKMKFFSNPIRAIKATGS